MTQQFKLPDLAEGVVEGELVSWLVKEGEQVDADQPLLEIMTDKATVEVPSPWAGVVAKLHFNEGDTVPVGALMVEIDDGSGAPTKEPAKVMAASASSGSAPSPPPLAASGNGGSAPSRAPAAAQRPAAPGGKVLATPATRKLAREMGVDLGQIPGTGPKGRITKADVQAFSGSGQPPTLSEAPATPVRSAPKPVPAPQALASDQRIPIRGLRKKIAEKMVRSAFTAPHFTFVEEVDVTELVAVREELKEVAAARGAKLTYLPFIIKALEHGFRKYPNLNAHMDDAAQELVVRAEHNMGIATATDSGLIVPVVKNCEQRSIVDLATEIARVSAAAREGKSAIADLQGSTFTITNLGALGGLLATPIINYPEVAILGVHKMRKTPVFVDEETVEAREMMNISLSFDHRVIDGHVGALFTQEIKTILENPNQLFLDLV